MMLRYLVLIPLAGLTLVACDGSPDHPVSTAPKPAPRPPVIASGHSDDAISYAPIDVATLDNQWWKQYSGGATAK